MQPSEPAEKPQKRMKDRSLKKEEVPALEDGLRGSKVPSIAAKVSSIAAKAPSIDRCERSVEPGGARDLLKVGKLSSEVD